MQQVLLTFLTFVAVVSLGGAWLAVRAARQQRLTRRLDPSRPSRTGQGAVPARQSPLIGALQKIGLAVSSGGPSAGLQERLARTGYHGPSAATIYLGAKILLFFAGLIGCGVVVAPLELGLMWKFLLTVSAGTGLSFLPNLAVALRRRKRRQSVRSYLPDAVDLLEVAVSSGMSLEMAWNLVTDEIRRVCTTLADEMALANLEIHLGAPRATAMKNLAERTGVDEIGSLVAVLVQSERFGTSMADALRTFANYMREGRSTKAEEAAERMAVRLLFPLALFIFPAIFVVLVGPAGIKLAEIMAKK